MKKPEEIKKGLECGDCKSCPYGERNNYDGDNHCGEVEGDALAYIQQLEAERDAAVEDMTKIVHESGESYCEYCHNWRGNTCPPYCRMHSEGFRWRGVQKEE